jgi:hypothetical protein
MSEHVVQIQAGYRVRPRAPTVDTNNVEAVVEKALDQVRADEAAAPVTTTLDFVLERLVMNGAAFS